MSISKLKKELRSQAKPEKAKLFQRFFKTGKGEYGEGDVFLGLTVPQQRKIAKKYRDLSLAQLGKLLASKIHEHRFTALVILVDKFQKAEDKEKKGIVELYLKNTKYINNWDLVDISAPRILGFYLLEKPKQRKILYNLARSKDLWKKRISILTTAAFIWKEQFEDALKISEILVNDSHDLIHKAVGWMLREIGKRDQKIEEEFLKKYYRVMPRTMLRYAIEKFSSKKRDFYLGRG